MSVEANIDNMKQRQSLILKSDSRMMLMNGYVLDGHHMLCPLIDNDKEVKWGLISFTACIKHGIVYIKDTSEEIFSMQILDEPEKFEWNGRKFEEIVYERRRTDDEGSA